MKAIDVCFKQKRPEDKIEGNKKYWYPIVGKAFVSDDNTRMDVKLHSVPINWDGELVVFLKSKWEQT